jgi:hypothetical protein
MTRRTIHLTLLFLTVLALAAAQPFCARAGEASVKCFLKTESDGSKAGSLKKFPLASLVGAAWDDYRDHCDFSSTQFLYLRGEINRALENDVKGYYGALMSDDAIRESMRAGATPDFIIFLSSEGGSVNAALRLGRFIRTLGVGVFADGECSSACVFLLAAGVRRYADGPLGVHKPYTLREFANASHAEESENDDRWHKAVTDYLADMHIPAALYDVMERTPPQYLHILDEREISEYQLDNGRIPPMVKPSENIPPSPYLVASVEGRESRTEDSYAYKAGDNDPSPGNDAVLTCAHSGSGCSFAHEYVRE